MTNETQYPPKPTMKIKVLKGIEKLCYTGAITGPILLFGGDAMDNYNLSLTGAGLFVATVFGALYTNTKRKELQLEQYWKEEKQKHDERYSELNDFVKEYSGRK
ncbi:MAG: hypothetical protein BWY36_00447 [Candidatus Diapherotrites archaeon ADurb.Bin253]|nr:MAG: hypothetical protein BWY36_00447 [Candidatus Diapherotrites archaeon ADurb.Bin253]